MNNFSENHFNIFSSYIYHQYGIKIEVEKKTLLMLKLDKCIKYAGLETYDDLYQLLKSGKNQDIINNFAINITTNTTEFFRENEHFEFLRKNLNDIIEGIPRINRNKEIRIWSAGCSTGQEPTTIAMVLKEALGNTLNIKILATDINHKVLKIAMDGQYPISEAQLQIPKSYLLKYFDQSTDGFHLKKEIKDMITYRSFNLVEDFQFKKGFDIIFCRNVMIYFDSEVLSKLVGKFEQVLVHGGIFFIGHSESLLNKRHTLHYLAPAIYQKTMLKGGV